MIVEILGVNLGHGKKWRFCGWKDKMLEVITNLKLGSIQIVVWLWNETALSLEQLRAVPTLVKLAPAPV